MVGGAPAPAAAAPAAAPTAAPSGGAKLPDSATPVFMPALSSTMTEGKIVQWTKAEGDKISAGEMCAPTFLLSFFASPMNGLFVLTA